MHAGNSSIDKLMQEHLEFNTSRDYIGKPCLKKTIDREERRVVVGEGGRRGERNIHLKPSQTSK
jgi:hypothetical protein